jgi:hypothetical protein
MPGRSGTARWGARRQRCGRPAPVTTEAGLAEVRRRLVEQDVDHTMRLEPVLRTVFSWLMSPDDLRPHLEREAAHSEAVAATYRQFAAAKDRDEYDGTVQVRVLRVAVEAAPAEVKKILAGLRMLPGNDPASWLTVAQAVNQN